MRRLLSSLALAISVSALSASAALAEAPEGALKAPLYGPEPSVECETGGAPTVKTFGFAVLDTPGNEMTLSGEVSLKRAAPKTTYEVVAVQDPLQICLLTPVGTITTNKKGNGNLHFATERIPSATKFWVELNTSCPGISCNFPTYASPAVELD